MEYFKLQIGCLLVIAYIAFLYVRERRRYEKKLRLTPFDGLLALGILSLTLDDVTAWTVNHLDIVPPMPASSWWVSLSSSPLWHFPALELY